MVFSDRTTSGADSVHWRDSLDGCGDDELGFLAAGSREGGFLSLEEIDESEYGFISGIDGPNLKKRKLAVEEADGGCDEEEDKQDKEKKNRKKKKKLNKRDKNKKKISWEELCEIKEEEEKGETDSVITEAGSTPDASALSDVKNNDVGYDSFDSYLLKEDEVYAWNELRLHPLIMKSIRRLGFRDPTPIQKACIPCAAHKGKDVIGAAETGSGKTLAFGLPILQRLLEEREKSETMKEEENDYTGGPLRALIVTPTRELALQISDHLKEAAMCTNIIIVPIVGGMYREKQERLLKRRPEIIVGTPGRLWELMSGGEEHLVELQMLSFFVLDEADRMIENGHFHELHSIIDMLPVATGSMESCSSISGICQTIPTTQGKKRQTLVFSATIALSDSFRKKLKHRLSSSKTSMMDEMNSIEKLSQRAGIRPDAAIIDLTNSSIMTSRLEESFIECSEETKDAYLYYILSIHGQGRTLVFCTSISALRRISSLLRILGINVWTLHAQMQQRSRLKALDRFRGNDKGVLVATDVAARGLDIPCIGTVVHYQLPHSADVYIHRSGRTARASNEGCSVALISPADQTKFFFLCRSLSKESLKCFPVDDAYLPELMKRLSLAYQIDNISRRNGQDNAKKNWFENNARSLELVVDGSDSEEETVKNITRKKINSFKLTDLEKKLRDLLTKPMRPKTFSGRFFTGAGVSSFLQKQLEELSKNRSDNKHGKKTELVIGQDPVGPLQALRIGGKEVMVNIVRRKEMQNRSVVARRKERRQGVKNRRHEKGRKELGKNKGVE